MLKTELTLIQSALHAAPLAHMMDEYAGGHREEQQAGERRDKECARLPVEGQGSGCLLVQLLQLLVGQVLQRRWMIEMLIFRKLSALQ